jgi:hypothetical protein
LFIHYFGMALNFISTTPSFLFLFFLCFLFSQHNLFLFISSFFALCWWNIIFIYFIHFLVSLLTLSLMGCCSLVFLKSIFVSLNWYLDQQLILPSRFLIEMRSVLFICFFRKFLHKQFLYFTIVS